MGGDFRLDPHRSVFEGSLRDLDGLDPDVADVITATDSRGSPLINELVSVVFKDSNGTKMKLYEGYTDSSGSVDPIIKAPDGLKTGAKGTLIIEGAGETMTKPVTITDTATNMASAGPDNVEIASIAIAR